MRLPVILISILITIARPGLASEPWWQGPLSISDVQLTPDEIATLGPDKAASLLADLGFNLHEQALPALPGYEGSYLRKPWAPEQYRAFFKACHAHAIRVTPYLNVHGFYAELARDVLPALASAVSVRPTGGKVLAVYWQELLTRYEPVVPQSSPEPAVLVNRVGRGTAVFLPGSFGASYWQHRFPDYRRLMTAALALHARPPVILGAPSTPDSIEVSWRQTADGRWVLHLVNHTAPMARPIEHVLPVENVRIRLPSLAGSKPLVARALVAAKGLPVEAKAGVPCLTLPRLEAYEVVVIAPGAL